MRCVATFQITACVQKSTLNLLNVMDVLGHPETSIRYLAEMAGTNILNTDQHCVSAMSPHRHTIGLWLH